MTALLSTLTVLAAEAGAPPAAGQAAPQATPGLRDVLFGTPLVPIMVVLLAWFWFSLRSQRKRERVRQEMLDAIQPKDDVVTVGGIHGRVIRVEDDKVTLRVDHEKDVKITVARSGISRKIGQEEQK